jgi:hypothetical protein
VTAFGRYFRPWLVVLALILAGVGYGVVAQIEGSGARGVTPLDTSNSLEVGGIEVDVFAKSARLARDAGWRDAQRKGWRLLWAKYHGGSGAPAIGDGALDSLISSIVIEEEHFSENRYVAKLGIIFDRVRAGEVLGVSGQFSRSAPLLVIPVQWAGQTAQSFEARTEWQQAWARFRAGSSSIDYVRPSGTGADPLLLNLSQTGRPGRRWWRALLDQYGAADVVIPTVRVERSYPGGPVKGYFTARYGPDNRVLESFVLEIDSPRALAAMMDEGVKRMDGIYNSALSAGLLRPDTSLIIEQPVIASATETTDEAPVAIDQQEAVPSNQSGSDSGDDATSAPVAISTFTIQFDSPDEGAISSAESAVRGIPGVKSATITSLALEGTSVMRVNFAGDAGMMKLALSARGYSVSENGGTFRISR